MKKITKSLQRILKSDLTYALIFLSLYLGVFLNKDAGVFFISGFAITFTLVKIKNILKKYPLLIIPVILIPTILGYVFVGVFEVVGYLLGSSIAGFMLGNYFASKPNQDLKESTLIDLQEIIKITSINQVLFSLYFFYTLLIQDIRGQNKLDNTLVFVGTLAFLILIPLTQIAIKKLLYKRLDIVSYINILFLTVVGIVFATLYSAFVEIGIHNIILPIIFSAAGIMLVSAYTVASRSKHFKFKKSVTTMFYVLVPLVLMLYYPWSVSRYLGVMFSTLTLVLFLPSLFLNEKYLQLTFRITNMYVFIVNIYILLMGLFSLSSKGIIARLNIANINYLLLLMFGVFLVMFLNDIKEGVHQFLQKYNLASTYSVLMVALGTLVCYLILDLGGIEGIGSFLFGIIGYLFIKNAFELRGKTPNSTVAYTYLEDNLLNLLTVLTLSLVLVKV
jgi:hypothetical protein